MRGYRRGSGVRLITAVALLIALVGPLVPTPRVAVAASAGTLTIKKVTSPSPDPFGQTFSFTATRGGTAISGVSPFGLKNGDTKQISLDNSGDQSARTYVITESSATGWTLSSITCSPNSVNNWTITTDTTNRKVTIRPPSSSAGTPSITCTFTNTAANVGSLTIRKVTDPSPDPTNQDFGFTVTKGGSTVTGGTFDLNNGGSMKLPLDNSGNTSARTYIVTESATANWQLTNLSCSGGDHDWDITTDKANRTARIVLSSDDDDTGNVTCTFTNTNTSRKDLTVSKTVTTATYDRTYNWTLAKTIDEADSTAIVLSGSQATFNYNVTASQTGYTDGNWKLAGKITVANPNSFAVSNVTVTDSYAGGGTCTVINGTNVQVPANSSVELNYSCTFTAKPDYSGKKNTATASWSSSYNLPHTSASGQADVTFVVDKTPNKTITVKDDKVDLATPETLGTAIATDGPSWTSTTWEYPLTFDGDDGTCVGHTNTATIDGTTITASKTVTVCTDVDLTVSKTATPTFDRAYNWTIAKSVDGDTTQKTASGLATFDYIVDVAPNGYDDSNWQITGTITITNPNDWHAVDAAITDVYEGVDCTVDDGGSVTIGAGESVEVGYTCDFTTAPPYSGTNTATVEWDNGRSATGTANVTFAAPTNETDRTITVTDSGYGSLGTFDYTAGAAQSDYSLQWSGTAATCTTHDNTATIAETLQSSSATVTVCTGADLTVSKTAAPTFDRTYNWTIAKSVDGDTTQKTASGLATFDYIVDVAPNGYDDSNWQITGTITITNPNDWQDIEATVTDVYEGVDCAVDDDSVTVPAGESVDVSYTCDFTTAPPYSGTNTATAEWDSAGYFTPTGEASGTAAVAFDTPTNETNRTVETTDSGYGSLGTIDFADGAANYPYSLEWTGAAGTCTTHDNTATIVETAQSDSATVTVCTGADLTVSKTATPTYTRTWNWQIDSRSTVSTLQLGFWQTGTIDYIVTASSTPVDSDWEITGTITVANPNDWQDVTATVTDVYEGVSCVVDNGGSVTVPAGQSVEVGYTCAFATEPPLNGVNTATAQWDSVAYHTPTGAASGTAQVAFGDPTTVIDDTITVTDSWAGLLGTATAGAEASSAATSFTFSRQIGPYAACTQLRIDNTGTFTTNDHNVIGSSSWSVDVWTTCEVRCNCTQTASYWVNMATKGGRRGFDPTWNLVGARGADTTFFASPYSYRLVLLVIPRGSQAAYYKLASQYVVADLNLLHGATAPQEVVDAMYAAKTLFETYTPAQVASMSSTQRAQLARLANTLYRYNMGFTGPGRCR